MKQIFTLLTAVCLLASEKASTQVVLNELYTDPSSGNHEFFELYNTNPSNASFSVNNITMVTFFDISGQRGFYVLDLPNMSVAARGFFVGSAAIPFNYQGHTNSTASDFNWNDAALAANQGSLKKWVQGVANPFDGNLFYDQVALPANFNDFFYRRTGSGASYSIFLYNNGQLINSFIGGTGGSATVLTVIVNMPPLFVDMSAASTDFTITFTGYGTLPVESTTQETGSDNGYIRDMDGACGTWEKSSSSKQHTPKASNGSLTSSAGSVSVSAAISRGTAATGSTVNYDVVGAPASYFPIELQVYTDVGASSGVLDATDSYVESNTENVLSDGPFYTKFYPYTAHVLIAVKTNAGCLDKILFIPNALVLSVNMISFTGSQEKELVTLNWKTEANEEATRFEVERSSNGIDFTRVAIVTASGKEGHEEYSFTSTAPIAGKGIYRLRIFNKSGKVEYSSSLIFENKEEMKGSFTILNNPVSDRLTMRFESATSQSMDIIVADMSGHVLIQQKMNSSKGINILSIPVPAAMKSGTYIVGLSDGNTRYSGKFIKQ
ncbi:MAG: T9SS type A sorting domain-containing protein [Chitinophagaceae bacterium]